MLDFLRDEWWTSQNHTPQNTKTHNTIPKQKPLNLICSTRSYMYICIVILQFCIFYPSINSTGSVGCSSRQLSPKHKMGVTASVTVDTKLWRKKEKLWRKGTCLELRDGVWETWALYVWGTHDLLALTYSDLRVRTLLTARMIQHISWRAKLTFVKL